VQRTEERSKEAPGRGRTAAPAVLKALEGCLKLLRNEETGKLLFHRSDVSGMTEEQQARALAAFKTLDKRVADLRRILN
jgi:predicted oxidoreductase